MTASRNLDAAHARLRQAIASGDPKARAAAVSDLERCWPTWREVQTIIDAGALAIRASRSQNSEDAP